MKHKYGNIVLLIFALIVIGCRKDRTIPVHCCVDPNQEYCTDDPYNTYSTDDFKYDIKPLDNPGAFFGPFYEVNESYSVGGAKVNPNDPYQIVYGKSDSGETSISGELWTFDFCNGQSQLVIDNIIDRLDWGVTDWLLYTGEDYNVFKVKSDGDSLTQLTNGSGIQLAGKWSPDGSKFWVKGEDAFKILTADGTSIVEYPGLPNFDPIDWIDNEHLLIVDYNTDNFSKYEYTTGNITQLNGGPICSACQKIYDRKNARVFVGQQNGEGGFDWFIYNLETGNRTKIEDLEASFHYSAGDYIQHTNKLSLVLERSHWKDSVANEIYTQSDLIIMNPDGTEKRLVELPH